MEGLPRDGAIAPIRPRRDLRRLWRVFTRPVFHEAVLRLNRPVDAVLDELAEHGIVGGYSLKEEYPELGESLLVCATETKTEADLEAYATRLGAILNK